MKNLITDRGNIYYKVIDNLWQSDSYDEPSWIIVQELGFYKLYECSEYHNDFLLSFGTLEDAVDWASQNIY